MTAQAMEKIYIKGKKLSMASQPLDKYFETLKEKPKLFPPSSACWRGYYGTWEIKDDDRLFLIDLECYTANIEVTKYWRVGMDFVFPNQNEVFADWFTGEVRIPHGDMLLYVHGGYASRYEKDLFLDFKNGYLVGYRYVNNILEEATRLINKKKETKVESESLIMRIIKKFWKRHH